MTGGEKQNSLGDEGSSWVVNYDAGRALNDTQTSVLNDYFDQHLKDAFSLFISLAPSEVQPTRINIILCALEGTPDELRSLLAEYPEVPATDPTYEQNTYFRTKLVAFNQLCRGKIDVNHELYAAVFDRKISGKADSPTKHRLMAGFFKRAVQSVVETSAVDLPQSRPSANPVRKKLF